MSDLYIRVLLIEDTPTDALLIRTTLTQTPASTFEVSSVHQFTDALQHLRQAEYDVILLDLGQSNSHSLTTLVDLLRYAPLTPIVVLTDIDNDALGLQTLQAGAQDYLVKQHSGDHRLARAIRYAIERKRIEIDNIRLYHLAQAEITERQRIEATLRVSEERFATAFRASPIALTITRLHDGCIVDANETYECLLGYSYQELIGHNVLELGIIPAAERAELVRQLLAEGLIRNHETILTTKSGATLYVICSMEQIAFAGEAHILMSIYDISQRKRAEAEVLRLNAELEQRVADRTAELTTANKELEAFSYSVSHDLRAPLRAINGFLHILLEDYSAQLPAEAQHYIQVVCKNAQQMSRLIDDLLAFSRLSRQPLQKRLVDPLDIVRQTLEELSAEQADRQLTITIGELPACTSDPALLKQVWINLIANALKYTRRCTQAEIEIGCDTTQGQQVYFIRDNGVGFDMRYSQNLFGVFQRMHRADEYEGTGVGLAIVQQIIRRHGGRIWAEAIVDQGASFFFTLKNE